MADDVITTSAALDDERRAILDALADTLLPASDDGVMPSAGDLEFWDYLNRFEPDGIEDVLAVVAHFDAGFATLPLGARVEALQTFSESEVALFYGLVPRVYGCYYQHDRVMEGIGLAKGTPFPRGNSVEPGDLSLLDAVTRVKRSYRAG